MALKHPHFLEELFSIAFDIKNPIHYKVCWVLDLVLMEDLTLINSQFNKFLEVLPLYVHHGALRSISKIVMLLAYSKVIKIDETQSVILIEMAFQWLSLSPKVATKAYSAYALNEFGKKQQDILPLLYEILEQDYSKFTAAYKSVARNIITPKSK